MAARTLSGGDANFEKLTCDSLGVRSGSITGAMLNPLAGVQPAQLSAFRRARDYEQADGAAVVADTRNLHVFHAAGTLVALEAMITGAVATGADRTVTIDLQKSTGGGAFATVLTGALVFTNGSALRTRSSATLGSVAVAAGDAVRVVVTVAGAAGAQAQGLALTLTYDEAPA